jgi:hypothetical protein
MQSASNLTGLRRRFAAIKLLNFPLKSLLHDRRISALPSAKSIL